MQAENNNDIAITEAKLKDFLSSVLSSEGIVVDIRRTFIEYTVRGSLPVMQTAWLARGRMKSSS